MARPGVEPGFLLGGDIELLPAVRSFHWMNAPYARPTPERVLCSGNYSGEPSYTGRPVSVMTFEITFWYEARHFLSAS